MTNVNKNNKSKQNQSLKMIFDITITKVKYDFVKLFEF